MIRTILTLSDPFKVSDLSYNANDFLASNIFKLNTTGEQGERAHIYNILCRPVQRYAADRNEQNTKHVLIITAK